MERDRRIVSALLSPLAENMDPGIRRNMAFWSRSRPLGMTNWVPIRTRAPTRSGMLDPVLQSQDPAQGQTAQGEGAEGRRSTVRRPDRDFHNRPPFPGSDRRDRDRGRLTPAPARGAPTPSRPGFGPSHGDRQQTWDRFLALPDPVEERPEERRSDRTGPVFSIIRYFSPAIKENLILFGAGARKSRLIRGALWPQRY